MTKDTWTIIALFVGIFSGFCCGFSLGYLYGRQEITASPAIDIELKEWKDEHASVGNENNLSIIDFNPVELIIDWPNWKGEISKDNGKTWEPACFVKGDRLRIWVEK